MDNLTIHFVATKRLIPYARNARTHSEAQVAQIAASIAEFGFVNPILVDKQHGIIAGHGRLLAAQQLGMKEVPVIALAHLTETQKRALIIADNRIALNAGWDEEMLRLELLELQAEDFNLDLIGFAEEELDKLLAPLVEEGNADADAVPEVEAQAVSQLGDVWIMGKHRLLCGDATKAESVEQVLAGQLADMVFTDPPYNVNCTTTMKDTLRGKVRPIKNDNLGDDFGQFLHDAITHMLQACKGALYICMSAQELSTLHTAFNAAGGKLADIIIWAKHSFTMGNADYQRQYEPILYGWKAGIKHYWCGARDKSNVWFYNRPHSNDLHPTMKPVELVEHAIENSSKSRDVVLDCFGGAGSTLIACEKAGRYARLIELDPKYCDVIVRRWQEYTQKKATLEAGGLSFAEVAAARLA